MYSKVIVHNEKILKIVAVFLFSHIDFPNSGNTYIPMYELYATMYYFVECVKNYVTVLFIYNRFLK